MRDLFKLFDIQRRSGKIQIVSKIEGIIVLNVLRKSTKHVVRFYAQNTIFILFNKSFQLLPMGVEISIRLEKRLNFCSSCSEKKST